MTVADMFQFQQVQFRATLVFTTGAASKVSIPIGAIQSLRTSTAPSSAGSFQFQQVQFREYKALITLPGLYSFNSNRCNSEENELSPLYSPLSFQFQQVQFRAIGLLIVNHYLKVSIPIGAIQSFVLQPAQLRMIRFNSNRCNSERSSLKSMSCTSKVSIPIGAIQRPKLNIYKSL